MADIHISSPTGGTHRKALANPQPSPPLSAALAHGLNYNGVPLPAQWKRDSSVALATRANDSLLVRIDELVDLYHGSPDVLAKAQITADLFFTLDYWLKVHKTTEGMNAKREPAVYGLYRFVAHDLSRIFGCGINALPNELEIHFGRRMSYHGEKLDQGLGLATYLTRAQAAKYRLTFKKGLAYMFEWDRKGTELSGEEKADVPMKSLKLVLADSRTAADDSVLGMNFNGVAGTFGGFVMSMGRDLYMARHHFNKMWDEAKGGREAGAVRGRANPFEQGNFYHSSYLSGDPVMCAGTIRITAGQIEAVANNSGHYRPSGSHFVALLEALRMHGVNLSQVDVCELVPAINKYRMTKAPAFLAAYGNWAQLMQQGRMSVKSSNMGAYADRMAEIRLDLGLVHWMWKEAVAAGIIGPGYEGRIFFVRTLLPSYVNKQGNRPLDRFVERDEDWLLDMLDQAFGIVYRPPGQGHGGNPGQPQPAQAAQPTQHHHRLPPPPPQAQGAPVPAQHHFQLPPPPPQVQGAPAPAQHHFQLPPPPPAWNG